MSTLATIVTFPAFLFITLMGLVLFALGGRMLLTKMQGKKEYKCHTATVTCHRILWLDKNPYKDTIKCL